MSPEQYRMMASFDENLKLGMVINARFTNNYNYYSFPAKITKINPKSLRVQSLVPIEGYDDKMRFYIWRFTNPLHTNNNGAFPISMLKGWKL